MPQDGSRLVMSERSGIELGYCPECSGRVARPGELDKILERNEREAPPRQRLHPYRRVDVACVHRHGPRDHHDPFAGVAFSTSTRLHPQR